MYLTHYSRSALRSFSYSADIVPVNAICCGSNWLSRLIEHSAMRLISWYVLSWALVPFVAVEFWWDGRKKALERPDLRWRVCRCFSAESSVLIRVAWLSETAYTPKTLMSSVMKLVAAIKSQEEAHHRIWLHYFDRSQSKRWWDWMVSLSMTA